MRVLHIIDSLNAGGKERQLVELLKGLSTNSAMQVELILLSPEIEYPELAGLGIKLHIISRRSRIDFGLFQRLHAVIKTFQPHIIHSWNSMCSIYVAPLARLSGAFFINGAVRDASPSLANYTGGYLRCKFLLPLTDIVVANSEAGRIAYRLPPHKSACIPNGFDFERTKTLKDEKEVRTLFGLNTAHIVGMVGNFTRFKDYRSFFAMAKMVLSLRNDVSFVGVGDGPDLEFFRTELAPYSERIKLPGRRNDVESIVNIFSIGILTSSAIHAEGISNSVMEYMALGKPVIATDSGGNRELIEEGRTGFLVQQDDENQLTNLVLHLLDNPAAAKQIGRNGRDRLRQQFSIDLMVEKYVALYRRLYSQKNDVPCSF